MPGASNEETFPSFVRFLIPFCNVTKKSLSPWRLLTVKLRGRTTTADRGRGPAISTGSRGPKQTTPHGPLQRLLEVSPMLSRVGVQETPNHLLVGNLGARSVTLEEIYAPFA